MGTHRQLIASMVIGVVLASCSSESSTEERLAPTVGRGTREDPPAGIMPPSSGATGSSGFVQTEGCPSKRTDLPMSPLTDDDVRALVVGIHRSCESTDGLEIRVDEETGDLHWYRVDNRFVRRPPPGFDGPLEIGPCEAHHCKVKLVEPDVTNPASTVYELSLWRQSTTPTLAMAFEASDGMSIQEWVRVAD